MERNAVCPKCESAEIIPGVRVLDRLDASDFSAEDLSLVIYESPDALLFRGTHHGCLRARVCGACGYTEMYVSNPGELLAAYKKACSER